MNGQIHERRSIRDTSYEDLPLPVHPPGMIERLPARVLKQTPDDISEPPNANLSLNHPAEPARLSPYHFARLFKETVGQTVHEDGIEQRLKASHHLPLSLSAAEPGSPILATFHANSRRFPESRPACIAKTARFFHNSAQKFNPSA